MMGNHATPSFIARLYESTGNYVCHPDVSIRVDVKFQTFTTVLCDEQGTFRQAILYVDRSCSILI